MADKPEPRILMRNVEMPETDWKWLTGWLEELLKISMDDMTADSLKLGAILQQIKSAPRDEDMVESDG